MSTTDSVQLLRAYAEQGDEAAFGKLVGRYIDLVYSAALRRVGGDSGLARDVTQTVFIDLARKAASLGAVDHLGGWLHRHTGFVAATLVRGERRRQAREQEAVHMNAPQNSPDSPWQQLAPLLDETIDSLEGADREALLLRFFEQRDLRSVGAALGISDDAAQKRVSRALEKLRGLLAQRGVALSAAVLVSLLTDRSVVAAPSGLAPTVCQAALTGTAATAGALVTAAQPAGALALKLLVAAAAVSTAAWLLWPARPVPGGGGDQARTEVAAASSGSSVLGSPTPASSKGAGSTAAQPEDSAGGKLLLTIVTADGGKPIPNVQLDYWLWAGERVDHRPALHATRFGVCEVPVPPDTTHLILVSQCDGFAETRLDWRPDRGEVIPAEYTLRLGRSVPISGRVVDADGQPVADARVGFNTDTDPASEARPQSDNFSWPFWVTATTDAEGRWRVDRIARGTVHTLTGAASHPEHVGSPHLSVGRDPAAEGQLLDGSYVFQLGRAVSVEGRVVDPDGGPVAGAKVLVGRLGYWGSRETQSGPDGSFTARGCEPGPTVLTAEAPGYAGTTLEVELTEGAGPFQLTLQRSHLLRLRVVDTRGNPVPKAQVWLDTFANRQGGVFPGGLGDHASPQIEFNRQTDPDGRLEWDGAPDQELSFDVSARGFMRVDDVRARPDGTEHLVTLPAALTIAGTVRDATTGQPIPKFRIITGWPTRNPFDNTTNGQWSTIDRFWLSFEGGEFQHVYEEPVVGGTPDPQFIFKFEAEGCAPSVSRAVRADEGRVQLDVVLRPAQALLVTVVRPDGQPAAGADVGLVSSTSRLQLMAGGFSRDNVQSGGSLLRTDSAGQFQLPPDDAITRVVVACPEGYGECSVTTLATDPTLRLQAWGRVEGTYSSGGQPAANRELRLQFDPAQGNPSALSTSFNAFRVVTDSDGRFVFPQVPPGSLQLVHLSPSKQGEVTVWQHRPLADVVIKPGETTEVTLGGSGYDVTVRVGWAAGMAPAAGTQLFAVLHTTLPVPPPADAAGNPQALAAWQALPEVRAAMANIRHYPLDKMADGTWTVADVSAGDYQLSVNAVSTPDGAAQPKPQAHAKMPVIVPADPPTGTLDLGELILQPVP